MSLCHVLGDARLRDLKPELEQLAVDARRPPKRVSMPICRISARTSVFICGRPPSGRDSSASSSESRPDANARASRTENREACRIDGNQRYSWIKNQR